MDRIQEMTVGSFIVLFTDILQFFSFSDYLLSNNHINSIIVHKFDFSDEEVRV